MSNNLQILFIIILGFLIYFLISYIYKVLRINNIENALITEQGVLLINLKHLIGILLFGGLFYVITPEFRYLFAQFNVPTFNVGMISLVVIILSGISALISAKKRSRDQTVKSKHSGYHALIYFPIRICFLYSYEFFFRGVLLFTFIEIVGVTYAIIICTSLYVLIHVFDSKTEILGAIPFGVLLCLLSYFTGSIWIPFIIHLTLSGIYEGYLFNQLTLKTTL